MANDIDADTTVAATNPNDVPTSTEVTQGTDVHQSKVPADDPRLRLDRPKPRTIKRGPVLLVCASLAGLLSVGLVSALTGSSKDLKAKNDPGADAVPNASAPVPEVIRDAPSGADADPHRELPNSTRVRTADPRQPNADPAATAGATTLRDAREEELIKARSAAIFVAATEGALPGQPSTDPTRRSDTDRIPGGSSGTSGASGFAPGEPARTADQNLQERKNDFLARAGVSSAEYLEKSLAPPRSPYEVKAGSVIPTVLITGISSDLPGQVVAQVRENVYDTVTGNYLLVPQGSRLLAAYDSMVAWGQQRVLICWNRLIRPDGSSVTLECMPGVDLAGYAGFSDDVDNHWWRIIGGAAVSSLLAATAQRSQGNISGYQPSVAQSWATGTAAGINEAGQQLTAKNLQLQPTITVRPGFSVNVLVTKDVVIPPYVAPRAP